ncbi:unnamed protein product, partial [Rotaria magnacalcarata]
GHQFTSPLNRRIVESILFDRTRIKALRQKHFE